MTSQLDCYTHNRYRDREHAVTTVTAVSMEALRRKQISITANYLQPFTLKDKVRTVKTSQILFCQIIYFYSLNEEERKKMTILMVKDYYYYYYSYYCYCSGY
ncbi:Hypothetical predicted protein [Xyrichtys novacula]|uniref:Uncharacterized protein n=1 Tax=Xyrichtys novacula TaxID=13765 RepID=A0AAV1FCM3_XYRNO|nr:Hypothetical predicted protein [Xyrichtys novacula]